MAISEKVARQFLQVRDTAKTNMLEPNGVQRVAYKNDWHALVTWIENSDEGSLFDLVMNGGTAVELDSGETIPFDDYADDHYDE